MVEWVLILSPVMRFFGRSHCLRGPLKLIKKILYSGDLIKEIMRRAVLLGFFIIVLILIAGCTSQQGGATTESKNQNPVPDLHLQEIPLLVRLHCSSNARIRVQMKIN